VKVAVTVALVPDAEFEKLKLADPAPPLTSPSSVSVNSIMISIRSLHITHVAYARGNRASLATKVLGFSFRSSSSRTKLKTYRTGSATFIVAIVLWPHVAARLRLLPLRQRCPALSFSQRRSICMHDAKDFAAIAADFKLRTKRTTRTAWPKRP
jgi:hypothetical protein